MRKVLLSAFEPFGGQTLNASQQVAREVKDLHFEGARVEVVELPVERFRSPQLLLSAFSRFEPDIVILLGEAGGRATITPERLAINVDDFPIPDNAGNCPREEPVVKGAPAAYFSTLPFAAIVRALQEQNIPTAISNTAGTYVCNHLFYGVMHHMAQTPRIVQAGFIHIPHLPEQHRFVTEDAPVLSREIAVKGVQIAVETCLRWL